MQIVGRPSKEISFLARLAVIGIELQLARPFVWTDTGHSINLDAVAVPVKAVVSDKAATVHVGIRILGFGFDLGLWVFWDKPCFRFVRLP